MIRTTLYGDEGGNAVIEFALIIPIFLTLLLGVFMSGVYLQNYNALRSVAADVSREVAVTYQRKNSLDDDEIEAITRAVAVSTPYFLNTDQLDVTAEETNPSRIKGAIERDLQITYNMAHIIPYVPVGAFEMKYNRPLFIVEKPGGSGSSPSS